MVVTANAGEPSITMNSAAQRWPWNNKIDVTYTVTNGQDRAAGLYCGVEFTITDGGRSHVLHGYTVGASAEGDADGTTHSVVLTAPSGIRSATSATLPAATVTFTPPEGAGLEATTWNKTGKGAEAFTFNAKGDWTVTLAFADGTTKTATITIESVGFMLIVR